jgi:hypothetical protein
MRIKNQIKYQFLNMTYMHFCHFAYVILNSVRRYAWIMKLTTNDTVFKIYGQTVGTMTGDIFFLSAGISFAFFIMMSIMGNMSTGIMFAPAFALVTFSLMRFTLIYARYFKADKTDGKIIWSGTFGKIFKRKDMAEIKTVRNDKYLKEAQVSGYKNRSYVIHRTLLVDNAGEFHSVAEDIDEEKIREVAGKLARFLNIPVENV